MRRVTSAASCRLVASRNALEMLMSWASGGGREGGGGGAVEGGRVDGGFAEGFTKLNHVFRRNMIALQLAADGADVDSSSSGRLSGQGGARQA
jgi:hypothetical protein